MRLSVLGAGYLGAVHATCMAHLGHEVRVYDVDSEKITGLAGGVPHFYEPGFNDMLQSTLSTARLLFTDSAQEAIRGAEMHFVCVGTPQLQATGAADLRFVYAAVRTILDNVDRPGTLVGKSTVPVGTARSLANLIRHDNASSGIEVAWNPEFLSEGTAISDTLKPDRLVFGVESAASERALKVVYEKLLQSGTPFLTTDLATSEMVKVAANSFLATKISFINAMAEICEVAGADVVTLSRALGYDDRIGMRYLNAGLGFGGGCLPKDIRALGARAGELGVSEAVKFLREVEAINLRCRERVVSLASAILGENMHDTHIAVLGAAFKPNSDDVRDSPALYVAYTLQLKGAAVRVHDPCATKNAKTLFPTLTYCGSVDEACADADLVVLATEWDEYVNILPSDLNQIVRNLNLIDARNALDRDLWSASGWKVFSLGRDNTSR